VNAREPRRRLDEFQTHVWDHTKDDFQAAFDDPDPLSVEDISLLDQLCDLISGVH